MLSLLTADAGVGEVEVKLFGYISKTVLEYRLVEALLVEMMVLE